MTSAQKANTRATKKPAARKITARKAAIAKTVEPAKEIARAPLVAAREIKAPKPGSKREIVLKLMARKQGVTVDEVQAATGWARGACSSVFNYDIHNQLGYGYRKDNETKAFHLVFPKGMKAPRLIQYTA